jgi:hypothetical protein
MNRGNKAGSSDLLRCCWCKIVIRRGLKQHGTNIVRNRTALPHPPTHFTHPPSVLSGGWWVSKPVNVGLPKGCGGTGCKDIECKCVSARSRRKIQTYETKSIRHVVRIPLTLLNKSPEEARCTAFVMHPGPPSARQDLHAKTLPCGVSRYSKNSKPIVAALPIETRNNRGLDWASYVRPGTSFVVGFT